MRSIIRSINYELVRTRIVFILYFAFALIMGLIAVLNTDANTRTSGMLLDDPSIVFMFPIFICSMIVGFICCPSLRDKVSNYEIMSGHSRLKVYLSRCIYSVILAAFFSVILSFIPMITGIILRGWGTKLVLSDVIIRQILLFFPFIRLAAFFVMLSFLIKNEYVILAIGFISSLALSIISGLVETTSNVFISIFNMNYLMEFKGWSIYNLSPVKGVIKYQTADSSVFPAMVFGTIAASLVMSVLYTLVGYAIFRRNDIN